MLSKPLQQNYIANQDKALYSKHAQQKCSWASFDRLQGNRRTNRFKWFFCASNLYAFACYGEVGEGHFRVCWLPITPVCQPFSALPPLFDSNRQSSNSSNRSA